MRFQPVCRLVSLLIVTSVLASAQFKFEFVQSLDIPAEFAGSSVQSAALSGDYAIILSTPIPAPDPARNQVHVFQRGLEELDRWAHLKTITQPEAVSVPGFAQAAALDGDTLIVTAVSADATPTDGRAFIFQRDAGGTNNWGFVTELTPSVARDDFGSGVAISADTAAVSGMGAVFLFERNEPSADAWGESKLITTNEFIGPPVALDGDQLFVGAPTEDAIRFDSFVMPEGGVTYLYSRDEGGDDNWGLIQRQMNPDDEPWDSPDRSQGYGSAVAIEGEWRAVGQPMYRPEDRTNWISGRAFLDIVPLPFASRDTRYRDRFGAAVGVDGDTIAVGNPRGTWPEWILEDSIGGASVNSIARETGLIRIYGPSSPGEPPRTWVQTLAGPTPATDDFFGSTLSMDGRVLVVAAPSADAPAGPGTGAAYLYERPCAGAEFSEYVIEPAAQDLVLDFAATDNCEWRTLSFAEWIKVTNEPALPGPGALTLSFDANDGPTSTRREAIVRIAGRDIRFIQLPGAQIFTDVAPADFFFQAVNRMWELGITSGCQLDPLEFCPGRLVNRAELAVFLLRSLIGTDSFDYPEEPYFDDVPTDHPEFAFIQKLRQWGFTKGCTEATYCPGRPVTRRELAVFLIRLRYGPDGPVRLLTDPQFDDVPENGFFTPFIQKLAEAEITNGCSPTEFCPLDPATRGQVAVLLLRAVRNEFFRNGYPRLTSVQFGPPASFPEQAMILLEAVNTHFEGGDVSVVLMSDNYYTCTGPANETCHHVTDEDTISTIISPGGFDGILRPGPYSIWVFTGTEEAVLPNAFIVP